MTRPAVNLTPPILTGNVYFGHSPVILTGTYSKPTEKLYSLYRGESLFPIKEVNKVNFASASAYQYKAEDLGVDISLREFAVSGGQTTESPISQSFKLQNFSDIVAWWDPSSLSSGSVSVWIDEINAFTASQSVVFMQPTKHNSAINGGPGVQFVLSASTAQLLQCSEIGAVVVGDTSVTWTFVVKDESASNRVLLNYGGTTNYVGVNSNAGGAGAIQGQTRLGGNALNIRNATDDLVNFKVATIIFDLTASGQNQISAIRINGTTLPFDSGTDGVDFTALLNTVFNIGSLGSSTSAIPTFGDIIWRRSANIDDELISMERFLGNKFNISW